MNGRCILLAGLLAAIPNLACAPVPGAGQFVRIDTEEALIVWDEGARREHFIRRAAFGTDAKDFGFLVPTPSRPELAEADDATFTTLLGITASPEAARAAAGAKSLSAVTVLEQKVVSGFDAAVLEATDAAALDGWLKQHGYPSSAELVDWYRPYVANGWKLTAFKIAAGSATVTTKPVRMSFQTERPFFPYREPVAKASKGKDERLLRVFFLADARFEGALDGGASWAGTPVWSNAIADGDRLKVLKVAGLPIMAGGGGRWLTEFEDRSSSRASSELYFSRVSGASVAMAPAPKAGRSPWELIAAALVIAFAAYGVWRFLRRRNG